MVAQHKCTGHWVIPDFHQHSGTKKIKCAYPEGRHLYCAGMKFRWNMHSCICTRLVQIGNYYALCGEMLCVGLYQSSDSGLSAFTVIPAFMLEINGRTWSAI